MAELTYSKCDCCGTMFKTSELVYTSVHGKEFDGLACKFCRPELLGYVQLEDITEKDRQTLIEHLQVIYGDESIGLERLYDEVESSELVLFANYKEYFYWKHEDCSKDYLIYLLYNDMNNAEEFIELEHGRIAYLY